MRFAGAGTRLLATLWRAPLAAAGAMVVSVVLGAVAVGLAGNAGELITADTGPGSALGLALLPTVGLVVATALGMACGVSVVAVLVRDMLAGQRPRLTPGWRRAWAVLPRLVLLAAVVGVAVPVAVYSWAPVSLVFAARALWRGWRTRSLRGALPGAWLIVPCAAAAALLAAFPAVWSALLSGGSLRAAARNELEARFADRAKVLAGLVALALISWGLGVVGLGFVERVATPATHDFALGTAGIGVVTGALIVVAGALLGLLAHGRGDAPSPPTSAGAGARSGAAGRWFWKPRRIAGTAAITGVAVVLPTVLSGAFGAAALALTPPEEVAATRIVVTSLADSTAPDTAGCETGTEPCGIRAAMTYAANLVAGGGSALVTFDVSGTVTLADTLAVPAGITVDATGSRVTLDAHHAFGAVRVLTVSGHTGRVTLRGLNVAGGRTDTAGAGLSSEVVPVTLDRVEFSDNVAGGSGTADTPPGGDTAPSADGGAVAVRYAALTVVDSLFVDNHAPAGVGGAVAANTLSWINSTSVRNSGLTGAEGRPEGGAIYAPGGGSVSHATVVDGGGVAGGGSPLTVRNSIVSTPAGGGMFACARIDLATSKGNVDETGTCPGIRKSASPLGTLADNGGPTRTIALQPGSPALGAGDAAGCAPTDQRGVVRPATNCDAGAFQFSSADVAPVEVSLTGPATVAAGTSATVGIKLTSEAPIPAGTITVHLDDAVLAAGVAVDANHEASIATGGLAQGPHKVTADFVPDQAGAEPHHSDALHIAAQGATTLTVTADGDTVVRGPATIHATLAGPDDPTGTPGFTGEVTFDVNGTEHTAPVGADGVATWVTDSLERARVHATWPGDDYHADAEAYQSVTTRDVATTTDASVTPTTLGYGESVRVAGTVTDATGRGVPAELTLLVDGAAAGSPQSTADGTFSLRPRLEPGTHTVAVKADPEEGWAASTSAASEVTVEPADAAVTLSAPATVSYPEGLDARVTVAGPAGLSDTVAVRLFLDDELLDTHDLALHDGSGTTTFTLTDRTLDAGERTLTAAVVASAAFNAASDSAVVAVEPVATTVQLRDDTGSAIRVGDTVTIAATVAGGGGGAVGTLTLTDPDGTEVDSTAVVDSRGTLTWVADRAGSPKLTVTYTAAPGGNHLGSTGTIAVDVARSFASAPTLTWSSPAAAYGNTLTVDFDAPSLTGTVTLEDAVYGPVGSATVSEGYAVVTLTAPAGECYCDRLRLSYSGDDDYRPDSWFAGDIDVPAHATTTTLEDLPAAVGYDGVLYLAATVTTPHVGFPPQGRVVFSVDRVQVADVALSDDGTARHTYELTATAAATLLEQREAREEITRSRTAPAEFGVLGTDDSGRTWVAAAAGMTADVDPLRELTITARYVPAGTQWADSVSAPETVDVLAVPTPRASLAAEGTLRVGSAGTVNVTTTANGWVVTRGTPITVRDSYGNAIGTGVWAGTESTPSARITVTPERGGPQSLVADFVYGPQATSESSAPLDVTVAGVPSVLTLTTDDREAAVDRELPITVTLDTSATPDLHPAGLNLRLARVDGKVLDEVTLADGDRSHTFTVTPTTRFPTSYVVTTTGDGRDYGVGGAMLTVEPRGIATEVFATTDPEVARRPGAAIVATVEVRDVSETHADPTGMVTGTLVGPDGHRVGDCSVVLPASECAIRVTDDLVDGPYTVDVGYAGDDAHEPSERAGAARLQLRTYWAGLEVEYPGMHDWLVGQRATATWTAYDPQAGDGALTGEVAVVDPATGETLCREPVGAGRCAFTVPDHDLPLDGSIRLDATYTPTTGSVPATASIATWVPRHCLTVDTAVEKVYGSMGGDLPAPEVTGPACTVAGTPGFVEGGQVAVTADLELPAGYAITGWRVATRAGGEVREVPASTYRFELTEDAIVSVIVDWKPRCVLLTTGNELGQPFEQTGWSLEHYTPGRLNVLTMPNCTEPVRTPVEEIRTLEHEGWGRYAIGTVVEVEPEARSTPDSVLSVARPRYVAVGVPGTDAPDAEHPHPHVRLTEDTFLYGRFRISPDMCTPLQLMPGVGGSLSVARSEVSRVLDPQLFEDREGRCTTADGQDGFLAGTEVTLRATPTEDDAEDRRYFVDRWLDEADLADADTRSEALAARSTGTYPRRQAGYNAYGPRERTITIGLPPPGGAAALHGVAYGFIACVPVTFDLTYPVTDFRDDFRPSVELTESDCPAKREPRTDHDWVRGTAPTYWQKGRDTYTRYYTPGTEVTLTAAPTGLDAVPDPPGLSMPWSPAGSPPRDLTWHVETRPTARDANPDAGDWTKGGSVSFVADAAVQVTGRYLLTSCVTPDVTVWPKGHGFRYLMPQGDRHRQNQGCRPGQVNSRGTVSMSAEDFQGRLQPVWEVWGTKDTVSAYDPRISYPDARENRPVAKSWNLGIKAEPSGRLPRVDLHYCAHVPVRVHAVDYRGKGLDPFEDYNGTTHRRPAADEILTDGDGCPLPLMVHPGTRAQVGVSGNLAQWWKVTGFRTADGPVEGNPTVTVDWDGKVVGPELTVDVTPRCLKLEVGNRVDVRTPVNCPGAPRESHLFLVGTPVTVMFDGGAGVDFSHWEGTDAHRGEVAVVVMNRNRDVRADYDSVSDLEFVANIVSNVEQRFIASLVTAATGLATGFLFVAQAGALLAVGIGEGLEAVGLDGPVADKLQGAGESVQAGIDVVGSLASCTTQWATGGGSPPLSPSSYQGEQGVDVGLGAADEAAGMLGRKGLSDAVNGVGHVLDVTNLAFGGPEAYLRDGLDSWEQITDIGSCIADTGRAAGNAVTDLGS